MWYRQHQHLLTARVNNGIQGCFVSDNQGTIMSEEKDKKVPGEISDKDLENVAGGAEVSSASNHKPPPGILKTPAPTLPPALAPTNLP